MSTILKALKKLEAEKASRGERTGEIAWDILRGEPRRRTNVLWLGGGLLGLALLGGGGVVLWWGGAENISQEVAQTSVPATLLPPEAAVAREAQAPAQVHPPEVDSPSVSPRSRPAEGQPPARAAAKAPKPLPTAQPQTPAGPVSRPVLHLTGIAFQEEKSARLAVVNDLPVMVGTVIEGALVEAIHPDRVVFSFRGERFSVSLGVASGQ